MPTYRAVLAALLTVGLLSVATPAQAQGITVNDPTGDAAGVGLDITSVTFMNRDSEIRATLTFVDDIAGDVIVAVAARHGHLVRVISEHRGRGADHVSLLDRKGRTIACSDLSSSWNRVSATLTVRLPAGCLQGGDYGAVRSWALTEEPGSGRDVDYAPEDDQGDIEFTGWLPRG